MPSVHRPEIDGLRAIAILPVISYHAGFPGFSGGFTGVDVFFVISGYLITGILLDDLQAGQYSLTRFYERRARRILPALFVMLAASAVTAHFLLMPQAFKDFSASVFAVALFLSNMLFISEVDYFAPAAEETPLLHTWSLAVEEQFYILFPLLLWLLWRIGTRRALIWGVTALTLASLAFSEWIWRAYPSETFYFLPSRTWELSLGALCALIPMRAAPPRPGLLQQGLALAGLVAILGGVVFLNRGYPFPSLWALLPVGGSIAVILFATPGTLAARLLSARAMVAVGLISYSAYLWHYPVFVFARSALGHDGGTLTMLGLSALSLLLAAVSWRFVEHPFRQRGGRAPWLASRSAVFAASAAGIAMFAGFGLWGYLSEGRAQLWLRSATDEQRQTYALFAPARIVVRNIDADACRFNLRLVQPDTAARLMACRAEYGPGLAIIGDSHAINLADALIRADRSPFVFGMTQGNCRPDTPRAQCGYDGFAALVARHPDVFGRILFEIAGQRLIEGPGGRRSNRVFHYYGPDTEIPVTDIRLLGDAMDSTVAYLDGLAVHVPVIWLTPRIELHIDDATIMARGCSYSFALRPGQAAIFDRLAEAIAARVAGHANLTAMNQNALLDFTMPRDFLTCEALLWRDGDHLGAAGLDWLGARLAPSLWP